MPGKFMSPDGDLETMFVDDYAMIDQYAMTGSLWNRGLNTSGNCGDGTITNRSSPVQTISAGTNWTQVASSAGIKSDGTLWLWGLNQFGRIGDNTVTSTSSPVQTISGGTNWKSVISSSQHVAAIKTDGTLWMWGNNNNGQLGDGTIVSKSSPVQTISGGTNWKQVCCNFNSITTAAIKTDGTLWSWGSGANGVLGNNLTSARSSPIQTIAGGTNWKQVGGGPGFTLAIKTDGTLWAWGTNQNGGIGDDTVTNRNSPVQTIAGGTNWKQVFTTASIAAATKTDGTLWTWASGFNGALGDGTSLSKSSPVQTISGGTNWKQLSGTTFGATISAIKTDGTLWAWGAAGYGALGDNSVTNKSSPVQTVAAGTNWKQVGGNGAIHFYDAGNLYPSA